MLDQTDAAAFADKETAEAIGLELDRRQNQIELIASKNIVSRDVLIDALAVGPEGDPAIEAEVRREMRKLCDARPIYAQEDI